MKKLGAGLKAAGKRGAARMERSPAARRRRRGGGTYCLARPSKSLG